MTDEQFEEVLKDMPSARTMAERAYRLGWEARGKRDEEVCREPHVFVSPMDAGVIRPKTSEECALAIAREGT